MFKPSFGNHNKYENGLQKGGRVVISYAPLWETMKKRGVTTYALINKHGVSPYTITMLKRNQSITMNTLEKLCNILDCTADNVVRFEED